MSKRDFGSIKSLLHFDFPYYKEPNDGLDDDVGIETWSKEGSAKFYGIEIPKVGTQAPKFGYRCYFSESGSCIEGTNNSGIWNLNSSKNYEIEFFFWPKAHGVCTGRYLVRLCHISSTDNAAFYLHMNDSGRLLIYCPSWGITSEVVGNAIVSAGTWSHILLRISNDTLKIFLNGTEDLSLSLIQNTTLPSINHVCLGGANCSTTYAFYFDEFVFRHSAGTGTPTIPTHPYRAHFNLDKVEGYNGYGNVTTEATTIDADTQINSYGVLSSITDAKTFSVSSWSNGSITPTAGSEVMIHITAPKSTDSAAYPLVGLYAFAKIESIDGTKIVLDREISTENGDDFTLKSSILSTYYVQVISVPRYASLTLNSSKNINPLTWSTSTGGGIVVLRTTGDCTINGNILTHGYGAIRYDLHQMTNSKLIDRFLCSQGGGVFISCGGKLSIPSTARLGASWSGAGDGSNGAAGYGGKGGIYTDDASDGAVGGSGGVGGGGGASQTYSGANCGADSASKNSNVSYGGSGGGGCGGKGGGSGVETGGGGGQGNSGKSGGTDTKGNNAGGAGTINGGNGGVPSNVNKWRTDGGGGAPGGNGGAGQGDNSYSYSAIAGASIVLICKQLNARNTAISTGGQAGSYLLVGKHGTGGSGGGGTGFCYIACEEQVSE